jgi:hypothetical protein
MSLARYYSLFACVVPFGLVVSKIQRVGEGKQGSIKRGKDTLKSERNIGREKKEILNKKLLSQ